MTAASGLAGQGEPEATGVRTPILAPLPEIEPDPSTPVSRFLICVFIVVPLAAVVAAVPVAWRWGLGWQDAVIALAFYVVSGLGISMGFHRHFTHSSFKAGRPLRVALGIAGSLAIEGPVLVWVADHRRHHKYSDQPGDPHSPWRFGVEQIGRAHV